MVIKIYGINGSPPARAVLMTVDILGLNIETVEVNTLVGDQYKPEFLEKNPLHTIPVLEESDFLLTDSHAIITYLVSKYGADKRSVLYPIDLRTRATIDQRLFFDASLVFTQIRNVFISIAKDKMPGPSQEQLNAANEIYGFIEKYLERSKFIAAEHITLADVSLVASISSFDVLIPVDDKYVRLKEWWATLKEKEWYKRSNLPGLEIFSNIVKATLKKNAQGN